MKSLSIFSIITLIILGVSYYIQQSVDGLINNAYEKGLSDCSPTELPPVVKEVEKVIEPEGIIVSLTIEDLYTTLTQRYSHISSTHRDLIMESIAKTADKHNISPLVIYSLIAVESSFRWWIQHPTVIVKHTESSKNVKARAVGLGGIVYEIWGPKLREAKIIETRSDLFNIEKNIQATGFIYSYLKLKPLHPKAHNPIESGLIRYFGGGYRSYFEKIDREIANLFRLKIYE